MTGRDGQSSAHGRSNRAGSAVLLAGGVVLVFGGFGAALGFSLGGLLASMAAIVALLYAGAVWFGGTPAVDPVTATADLSVILFTHDLRAANGPAPGRPLIHLFPAPVRRDLETHCRVAFDGQSARFACGDAQEIFEVAPVRNETGAVVYGLLLSGALTTATAVTATSAT